jgi:hypothetical protein
MGRTRERPEGLAFWGGPQGAPSGGRGYGWCEGGGKIHGTALPRLLLESVRADSDAPASYWSPFARILTPVGRRSTGHRECPRWDSNPHLSP